MSDEIVIVEKPSRVTVTEQQGVQVVAGGPRGAPGPSGAIGSVRVETPAGAIDGVNATFTTAVPFSPGTTVLYLNGLAQSEPQDYNEMSNQTILLDAPPLPGDVLRISYMEG